MRTYTIRQQRPDTFDVDFVLHDDAGPASHWARSARPGDDMVIGGPGPKKLVDNTAEWFLIVGDMTALPAISINLEQLPTAARGHAVIEVIDESDIQPLRHPDGIERHWLFNREDAPSHEANFGKLVRNRVDLVVNVRRAGSHLAAQMGLGGQLGYNSKALGNDALYLALRRTPEMEELAMDFADELQRFKREARYRELQARYAEPADAPIAASRQIGPTGW